MASPNVSFDTLPASIRKPGKYFEYNTRLAVRTLPNNRQRVVLIGQSLITAKVPPLQIVDVFSSEEAATYFGQGSQAHQMAMAAIKSNPYVSLQMIAVADAPTGVAATGSVSLALTANGAQQYNGLNTYGAGSGVLSVYISSARVDVAVAASDTATSLLTALMNAINENTSLPVTAAVNAGKLVVTAKNKGAAGNAISLRAVSSASAVSPTVTPMTGGDKDPDITPALTAIFAANHQVVVSPYSTVEALTALRSHLDTTGGALEQRGAIGVAGWAGSLSTGTTLATAINSGRITVGWHNGSTMQPAEIAAAYAAVIASEEDPARPLNTLALPALDTTALDKRVGRNEQEAALHNGLSPFEVGSGGEVQIVRAVTTYTKNGTGAEDVALLDITTIRTLDYVRKACQERITLRFPREKISSRTPAKIRSELMDVLLKLEEIEIVEQVTENQARLIVERDSQDVNRLNAAIPVDVVNGLHVFAGRIDLLL